jgi:hypothetical protein
MGSVESCPRGEIIVAVETPYKTYIGASEVKIFELWQEDAVSTLRGGWLEVLVDVMIQNLPFLLHNVKKVADDWQVELPGVELRDNISWENHVTRDDAGGAISEATDDTEKTYEDEVV